jgi:outer membrane protein OmpA-like peptidoglycan-associated protein
VPTRIANDELQSARQQMHTLSRAPIVRPCKPVKPNQAAAPATAEPNVITFGADASFRSKKADLKALAPNGKAALDQVLDKITRKYADAAQIKVHLIGYADDTGDEPVNQRLAVARAQTVQNYLLQNGMRAQELSLEGRNAAQLNAAESTPPSKMKVEIEVTVIVN